MSSPRFNSAAADRSAAKATPPVFAPHPDVPFPGNGFRLVGDGASLSSIAVAQVGARDSSTGAEAAPLALGPAAVYRNGVKTISGRMP